MKLYLRFFALLTCAALLCGNLTACGNIASSTSSHQQPDQREIALQAVQTFLAQDSLAVAVISASSDPAVPSTETTLYLCPAGYYVRLQLAPSMAQETLCTTEGSWMKYPGDTEWFFVSDTLAAIPAEREALNGTVQELSRPEDIAAATLQGDTITVEYSRLYLDTIVQNALDQMESLQSRLPEESAAALQGEIDRYKITTYTSGTLTVRLAPDGSLAGYTRLLNSTRSDTGETTASTTELAVLTVDPASEIACLTAEANT